MSDKLEAYLEEISHFLSGREERAEILAEIRSHIMEKAERDFGGTTGEALDRAVAAYGPARKVAEKYLEGRPIIAPAYKRHLFRYTSILFAYHTLLTAAAVIFKQDFIFFPFLFIPRLGVFDAVMFLPTAFLADLGVVSLILYFVTQRGKDVRLPWPRFGVDLDDVKIPPMSVWSRAGAAVGAALMFALTTFVVYLFTRHGTIFFVNLDFTHPRPLFTPDAGQRISIVVIAMFALSTISLVIRIFTRSRWVDAVSDALSLVLIGLLLRQPFDDLFAVSIPERLLPKIKFGLKFVLVFIALVITIDLIKNIVLLARRKLVARPK